MKTEIPKAPISKNSLVRFWNESDDRREASGLTEAEAITFAASLPAAGWNNIQIRIKI